VVKGETTDPSQSEEKVFTRDELGQGWRLACQVYPKGDCRVEIPPESMTAPQRTQVEGLELEVEPAPPVHAFKLKLSVPTLSDARADADRLLMSLKQQHGMECLKIDEEVLRIVTLAYQKTSGLIKDNIETLHLMAKTLLEKETLDAKDIDAIMAKAARSSNEGTGAVAV